MTKETLEMIIEELATALSIERWKNEQQKTEISKLKREISKLENNEEKENG